jgi:hypothetical protein
MEWWVQFWERWLSLAGRVLLAVGMVALILAFYFWGRERRWSHAENHATATVIELDARLDAQGEVNYFPHFRFWLPNHELVQVNAATGSHPAAFSAGQRVTVRYTANDPQDATIMPSTGQIYEAAIVLGIAGVVMFDAGAVLWALDKRREMDTAVKS